MQIGANSLAFLTASFVMLFTNNTFWTKAWDCLQNDYVAFGGLVVAAFVILSCVLNLVSVKYLIKPLFILVILIAAGSSYFVDTFGIVVDTEMMHNIFETDWKEASELIGSGFVFHFLLFAILPVAIISFVKIRFLPFRKMLWRNGLISTACLLVSASILLSNFSGYASAVRNNRDLMASLNPAAPIDAFVKYVGDMTRRPGAELASIGTDARQGPVISAAGKKQLVVFVLGETARARSFSLNGYERETNPQLARRDVISFQNVSSCGTATATSVPCMFSPFGRADFSHAKASTTENLIDVLNHAGVELAWWDNNTGSKGVADRIPYQSLRKNKNPAFCNGKTCFDDILLDRLKDHLPSVKENAFLVLHQLGSHGPSYSQRYPEAFRLFTPECATAELAECSREEIVNAYDNTIAYTDKMLADLIDYLKTREDEFDSALVYMSDHGESTGEFGLYLHGMPYMIAPESQTEVPFILWVSDGFRTSMSLDTDCLRANAGALYSHDNLFHSMLGLMNIETGAYEAGLDIFAGCRGRTYISASQPAHDPAQGVEQALR